MPRVLIALWVASIGAVLAACAQRIETVVETAGARVQQQVIFDTPIPEAPASMRLFALQHEAPGPALLAALQRGGERAGIPPSALTFIVRPQDPKLSPAAENHTELAPRLRASVKEAFANEQGGAIQLQRLDTASAMQAMNRLVKSNEGWRQDVTQSEVMPPRMLRHMRAWRDSATGEEKRSDVQEVLALIPVRRSADGFAIDGPGSRFTAAFADAQSAEPDGVVLDRKRADFLEAVRSAHDPDEVRADIERQIRALHPRGFVHVQSIKLAYYDGNKQLLQPVYRFIIELSRDASSRGSSQHLVGYVKYAETEESVPDLGDEGAVVNQAHAPLTPVAQGAAADRSQVRLVQTPKLPSVGRYIARNSSPDWAQDAHGFWGATLAVTQGLQFADAQYHDDATPAHFLGPTKDQFVNAVDIALVEAHGFRWGFATEGNSREFVDLRTQFDQAAYGADAAGRLKHWILHSCDVVASPQEERDWSKPWWGIFHGLQTVLGYHTPMFIDDGAGAAFGRLLAKGQPVLGSWFIAISSLNVYVNDPVTHSRCDGSESVGLASAVSACDAVDAVVSTDGKGKSDCLDVWWIAEETRR